MADRGKLLLLDGHSLAYRAFYALPVENFSTTTGQPTNAVYGFTSMLVNLLRDEQPTHVAVAFDVSRKSFRTERFTDYKATRSASPPEFSGQVELIKQVVQALNIRTLEMEGFEADDLIATLTTGASAGGLDVRIVSGDRDTFQLVDDHVTVLYPRKGVSDLARMTPEAVEEKYGLTPVQYPDFAALRGDPSDNLPGIPGVGEKTAVKWLTAYGDLTGVVDHVDDIGGKVGQALREAVPQVLLNRELTELVRDVPLPVSVEEVVWGRWSRADVDDVFQALQFAALRPRVEALPGGEGEAPSGEVPRASAPAREVHILGPGKLAEELSQIADGAIACAGSWSAGAGTLTSLAVCTEERCIASALDNDDDLVAALAWLADPGVAKDIHDVKGPDLAVLSALGEPT
ncbi:MAG TPA: 5'-3' exonuclease H3TH domain-containing protein, partial [Candidatus Nanopelagicales bacterium]|nr:5'-3' exonuclease H3TH domain-containing protein [Candidatus Nanopelagicales bacterium]